MSSSPDYSTESSTPITGKFVFRRKSRLFSGPPSPKEGGDHDDESEVSSSGRQRGQEHRNITQNSTEMPRKASAGKAIRGRGRKSIQRGGPPLLTATIQRKRPRGPPAQESEEEQDSEPSPKSRRETVERQREEAQVEPDSGDDVDDRDGVTTEPNPRRRSAERRPAVDSPSPRSSRQGSRAGSVNPSSETGGQEVVDEINDEGDESRDGSPGREGSNQNGNAIEEGANVGLWTNYNRAKQEQQREQHRVDKYWKEKVKEVKSKQNDPWKALLLESCKKLCGNKIDNIFNEFPFDVEDRETLMRKWKKNVGLKKGLELGREYVVLVKFLVTRVDQDSLFKAMVKLNLKSAWDRRDSTIWKVYKIELPDGDPPKPIARIRQELKNSFNKMNADNDGRQFGKTERKDDTLVTCILTENIKYRKRAPPKPTYSVVLVAGKTDFDNFPYLLIQGNPTEDMLESLSDCYGGTNYKYMDLRDSGYNSVLGALKQPTYDEINQTKLQEIQDRIRHEEEETTKSTGMISFKQHMQNLGMQVKDGHEIKKKLTTEVLKTEPEEGGMKNLKLEYRKPGLDKPIIWKFMTTKKGGSVSSLVSKMYEHGTLKNEGVAAFLEARNRKTNNLKLEWSEEEGKYVPKNRR